MSTRIIVCDEPSAPVPSYTITQVVGAANSLLLELAKIDVKSMYEDAINNNHAAAGAYRRLELRMKKLAKWIEELAACTADTEIFFIPTEPSFPLHSV